MTKQKSLVQTWLAAIGLAPHILETFEAAGIVNPKDLAELEICHYPALGVQQPGDRKKLFYLVQRVKMAVPEGDDSDAEVDITISGVNSLVDGTSGNMGRESMGNISSKNGVKKVGSKATTTSASNGRRQTSNTSKRFGVPSPRRRVHNSSNINNNNEHDDRHFGSIQSPQRSDYSNFSSEREMDGLSSDEGVPSPPRNKNNQSRSSLGDDSSDYDLDEILNLSNKNISIDSSVSETKISSPLRLKRDESPSFRNKREEAFLTRMNDRLSKLSPMRSRKDMMTNNESSSPTKAKNTRQSRDSSPHLNRDNSKKNKSAKTSTLRIKIPSESSLSKKAIKSNNSNSSAASNSKSVRRPKSAASTSDSSPIKSLTRKALNERSRRPSPRSSPSMKRSSPSTVSSRGSTNENRKAEIQTKRTSKRLQEKNAKDMMSSKLTNNARRSKRNDKDDQSSVDSRRTNISSSTNTTANATKKMSTSNNDENDLDSILDGDSIDSPVSDSSSYSREQKQRGKKKSNVSSKRLSTIPSGRIAVPSTTSFPSFPDDEKDIDYIPPNETTKVKSKRNKKSDIHDLETSRSQSAPKLRPDTTHIDSTRSLPNIDYSSENTEPQINRKKTQVNNGSNGMVFVHGKRRSETWTSRVDTLREANDQLYQDQLKVGRLDSEYEEEMRIRVVVRKRPMSRKEAAHADDADVIHPMQYNDYGRILVYQPKTRVDLTREVETIPFAFDNVFNDESTNCQIYDDTIKNLIPGAFEGRWASVFAYGQTGSGKTFTMMGSTLTGIKARTKNVNHEKNYGLYLLAARDLFRFASRKENSHFTVGASLFEIYGGKLFDLLNDRSQVRCLENHQGRVCFPGLSEHKITSADDLMKLIEKGADNRSTGSTSANRDSSRSHAILQLHLRKSVGSKTDFEHGRLSFIDLAGSERGADTDQASRTTRLEGAEINTSLLALKEVIRALATGDAMTHIPFRGSKLTQVLKESFVGKNSRTVMVACVAPNMTNCEHTLNTLRYADRVKERNSETGELTAAIEAASKIQKKANVSTNRPVSAPVVGGDIPTQTNTTWLSSENDGVDSPQRSKYSSHYEGDDDWLSDLDDDEIDDEEDMFKVSMDELNEVLKSPVKETRKSFTFGDDDSDTDMKQIKSQKPQSKKEAAAPLISSHRSIMSEMLGMVKQEMTLVNCTDEDRALIDEYLDELEEIQDKQLSMISSLRQSLVEYYGNRPSVEEADDSFEALLSS